MSSLGDTARDLTALDALEVKHLQRLVASWGALADFCFSDLLLFAPIESEGLEFVVLGQIRPATGQTVYRGDWVGTRLSETDRPLVTRSFTNGEIIEGEIHLAVVRERVRVLCIPVRHDGKVIGVLTRESAPSIGRQHGELERTYLDIFNRFARMIASGDFPYKDRGNDAEEAPRVGDGVLLLDDEGRVEYSSPNAISALHRVGVHANAEGLRFGEFGLDESLVKRSFQLREPVVEEIERGPETTIVFRCMPLIDRDRVSGAVVLVRDISELRRRDRLLLSKDATIKEIHHRVKNNLQTISSLLRLTGRRLESPEAKAAVEESARRIRSIALVHETLSREAGDDVPFIEIVRPLSRMVEEGLFDRTRPLQVFVEGEAGTLPAAPATSLAVVLNELLQNAIDHAFPRSLDLTEVAGRVDVRLQRTADELIIDVEDNGVGVAADFDAEATSSLGLSIVGTLVTTELAGEITFERGDGPPERAGTLVRVRVPTTKW